VDFGERLREREVQPVGASQWTLTRSTRRGSRCGTALLQSFSNSRRAVKSCTTTGKCKVRVVLILNCMCVSHLARPARMRLKNLTPSTVRATTTVAARFRSRGRPPRLCPAPVPRAYAASPQPQPANLCHLRSPLSYVPKIGWFQGFEDCPRHLGRRYCDLGNCTPSPTLSYLSR